MLDHLHIVVADDDPELLRTVADALERAGANVARAETGGELIERIANDGPFDLVVTDISMPWMNGLQAMHSARYAGAATPVVVMTALKGGGIPDEVRKLGHRAELLRKPFDLAAFERAAARVLGAEG